MSQHSISSIHCSKPEKPFIISKEIDSFLEGLNFNIQHLHSEDGLPLGFKKTYKHNPSVKSCFSCIHITDQIIRVFTETKEESEKLKSINVRISEEALRSVNSFKNFFKKNILDEVFDEDDQPVPL